MLSLCGQSSADWTQSIVTALISACAGAFAAYFFARLLWLEQRKAEGKVSALKELMEQVSSIEDVCLKYWLSERCELGGPECDALEIRINASITLLARTLREQRAVTDKSDDDMFRRIEQKIDDLFDVATGSDFKSASRAADAMTAQSVSKLCLEIEILLSNHIRKESA